MADYYWGVEKKQNEKYYYDILIVSFFGFINIIGVIPKLVVACIKNESLANYTGYIITFLIAVVLCSYLHKLLSELIKKKLPGYVFIILSLLLATTINFCTYLGLIPQVSLPETKEAVSLNTISTYSTSYVFLEENASTDNLVYTIDKKPKSFPFYSDDKDIYGTSYETSIGGNYTDRGQKNSYKLNGQYDSLSFTAFMHYDFRNTDPEKLFNATFFKLYFDGNEVYCYDVRNGFDPDYIGPDDLPSLNGIDIMEIEILGNSYIRIGDFTLWG